LNPEIKKELKIPVRSDSKGYFDRECPSEKCKQKFKVNLNDWDQNSKKSMYCPFCHHFAPYNMWHTSDQVPLIEENCKIAAENYGAEMINAFSDKMANIFNHPGSVVSVKYNRLECKPLKQIGQSEEYKIDAICIKCGCKYSFVGTALFCPFCGENQQDQMFPRFIDLIKKRIRNTQNKDNYADCDLDTTESLIRDDLEHSISKTVSCFQDFASFQYKKVVSGFNRPNDFQNLGVGNNNFKDVGVGEYKDWTSDDEMSFIRIMFQKRHIIEHNGGIVDEEYLKKSGDTTYKIGERLSINCDECIRFSEVILKLGTSIKDAVEKKIKKSSST